MSAVGLLLLPPSVFTPPHRLCHRPTVNRAQLNESIQLRCGVVELVIWTTLESFSFSQCSLLSFERENSCIICMISYKIASWMKKMEKSIIFLLFYIYYSLQTTASQPNAINIIREWIFMFSNSIWNCSWQKLTTLCSKLHSILIHTFTYNFPYPPAPFPCTQSVCYWQQNDIGLCIGNWFRHYVLWGWMKWMMPFIYN